MSTQDKDQIIEQFTKAYKSANGKEPSIEAKGGWYSIDGAKNVRLAALEEMTAELEANAGAKSKTTKSEKAAPSKTKKAAAKPKATKKAKSKSDFSVKAYWEEQIMARNPGSKLPR
ncbi:hypothetical protein [Aliiglaciecola lipolytica]|uniref:Uncharacterized protein n=1 Tax=Aliiglaciecola lipolytica E3 TaxID=1127673 RepID=K6YCH5_9ALTE|nr:hypothetical protein [Aliiglaciecola lipolytica]GAC14313.1 hypothetical protein GLIP_1680 [Aliiglaciecola lipolytica E3]